MAQVYNISVEITLYNSRFQYLKTNKARKLNTRSFTICNIGRQSKKKKLTETLQYSFKSVKKLNFDQIVGFEEILRTIRNYTSFDQTVLVT